MNFLEAFEKNMTVSDVHVASEIGSGRKRKKRKPIKGFVRKGEAEFGASFQVVKVDTDKRQIFGWASVSAVGGVDVIDKQDDIIPIDELEKAVYNAVPQGIELHDMHDGRKVGHLIDSTVYTPDKEAIGAVFKNEKGQSIHGWMVGFQVTDASMWARYKSGTRPEFSIGGNAIRGDA